MPRSASFGRTTSCNSFVSHVSPTRTRPIPDTSVPPALSQRFWNEFGAPWLGQGWGAADRPVQRNDVHEVLSWMLENRIARHQNRPLVSMSGHETRSSSSITVMSMRRLFFLALLIGSATSYATEAFELKQSTRPNSDPKAPEIVANTNNPVQPRAPIEDHDTVWGRLSRAAALRDGPSGRARILSNIGLGTEVKIMWRRRDGWVQIKLPASSQVGWTRGKNLALVTSDSKVDQIDTSDTASIDRRPNQKLQQTNPKLSRSESGRKHRKGVASSHRIRRLHFTEHRPQNFKWRGRHPELRTFGYYY